jgi:hypothetical protein
MKYPIVDVIASAVIAYQKNENKIIKYGHGKNANVDLIIQELKNPSFSEEQRQEAETIIQFIQHQAVLQTLLGKKQNAFLISVSEYIKEPTVPSKAIGLLAWAPQVYERLQKSEEVREQWSLHSVHSKHLGRDTGEKISCTFNLLEKRFVQKFECWSVVGVTDEGDIVSYFCNNENKIVQKGTIKGRIKHHTIDAYRGDAKITVLNYVKELV